MSATMQENNPLLELFIQQLAAAKLAQAIKAAQENGGVFSFGEGAGVGGPGVGLGVGYPEGADAVQNRSSSSPSGGSPRRRRASGSIGSHDGGPGSPRLSPRESLTSSPPTPRSPRATTPTTISQILAARHPQDSLAELAKLSSRGPIGLNDGDFDAKSPSSREAPLGMPGPRGESPLDLSAPRKRAAHDDPEGALGKMPHVDITKAMGAWPFPLPPQLAYLALRPDLAALAPDLMKQWATQQKMGMGDNTTKLPPSPIGIGASGPLSSETSRALERMSELSKFSGNSGIGGGANRATPWQNHWLSKGQDATKDILKCVFCKISFNSLEELTTHMKEAKHYGPNFPKPIPQSSPNSNLPPQYGARRPPNPNQFRSPTHIPTSSAGKSYDGSNFSSDNLMPSIRDGMNLPRKLVRGQDVWIGRGAEQTRQILKCMWCGESFKTLQDLTTHMQKTKHYANIMSQEQIISWKSPDEKSDSQQHVNAVLTCKVCDLSFSSLKELSDHMVKNQHYKEHIMKSMSESGMRKRPKCEKRKKTLPVRKLLELERAQQDLRGYSDGSPPGKDPMNAGKILCDKCDEKIDAMSFIDHIHNCEGRVNNQGLLKSALLSPGGDMNKVDSISKSEDEFALKKQSLSPSQVNIQNKSERNHQSKGGPDSSSALNSLENLIKSSFEPSERKTRPGGPLGSSILRRLGIDETADYSKPIMDPQFPQFYSGFPNMQNSGPMSPGRPLNLPPSFHSEDRHSVIQGVRDINSPGMDSDTSDTYQNSPSQRSIHDFNGSASRDWGNNDRFNNSLHLDRRISPSLKSSNDSLNNGLQEDDVDNPEKENEEINNIKEESEDKTERGDTIKKEAEDIYSNTSNKDEGKVEQIKEIRVKDEFKLKEESDEVEQMETGSNRGYEVEAMEIGSNRGSPTRSTFGSPARSGSVTPHSENGSTRSEPQSGLSAMAAMLGSSSSGGGGSDNPLAALQMLCEKTETPKQPKKSSNQSSIKNQGSMLAFSWACNDAVTADSIIKCALCDTPFISKGAYRHHLSKMHFLKDGSGSDTEQGSEKCTVKINKQQPPPRSKTVTPPSPKDDDTPQSRFLKYTELAKQLSSK